MESRLSKTKVAIHYIGVFPCVSREFAPHDDQHGKPAVAILPTRAKGMGTKLGTTICGRSLLTNPGHRYSLKSAFYHSSLTDKCVRQ